MACHSPIMVGIRRKSGVAGSAGVLDRQQVGCGSCLGCRIEQARQWTVRIMHEADLHLVSSFVTLTYNDEALPENGSLHPPHFRAFVRSVRRAFGGLRYFGCGEYGETTFRPHYHAVLFGPEFLDRVSHGVRGGYPVWRSGALEACWPHGHCEFGSVTKESAAYVAGYVRKKVGRKVNPNHLSRVNEQTGEVVEVVPEFSRMSLRPAIGRRWLERYWRDVYPRDFVAVDGKEYKPPRYYDKVMDELHPEVMTEVRYRRLSEMEDLPADKLRAKAAIQAARVSLFQARKGV